MKINASSTAKAAIMPPSRQMEMCIFVPPFASARRSSAPWSVQTGKPSPSVRISASVPRTPSGEHLTALNTASFPEKQRA